MPTRQRQHSNEWPPTLDRRGPDLMDWRITRLEETVDQHQERMSALEARPSMPHLKSIPWAQVSGLAVLIILGATGRLSPELVEALSKLLPGR